MASALSHITVLDLSRVLAGPWSTQALADLGATVIKVEAQKGGDDTRKWGPPFMAQGTSATADAAYFAACNRTKSAICIDFSRPDGAALVRQLAAKADVVVENFKKDGLAKYGLDYEGLKAVKPDIIYCSITGFGQTGPYSHRAGYDFLIQGMAGLMSVTGQPEGAPGHEPMKVGVAVSDLFTGMYAALSISAAVIHRDRTGEGQHIDCSLFDTTVAMMANQASNYLVSGVSPVPMGNSHPNVVPYRVFAVQDGHVVIACGNDDQFQRLCDALDLPDLARDARFTRNSDRIRNREVLESRMGDVLARLPRQDVIDRLERVQVSCGPINRLEDVFQDPHAIARGLSVPLERPDGMAVPTVAYPAKLEKTPARFRSAPPALGADTDAVLRDVLDLDDEAIEELRDAGIVGVS